MYSIFDLFKVGVGPSSSHTVGPMIAAGRFARDAMKCVTGSRQLQRLQVTLYGSLALTGAGHATDTAILAGLSGCRPDQSSPDEIQLCAKSIRETKRMRLIGEFEIGFDVRRDLEWKFSETLPQHPNGIAFRAWDHQGQVMAEDQYFSTGGGFVYSRAEFGHPHGISGGQVPEAMQGNVPYAFSNAAQMIDLCRKYQLSIDQLIQRNELALRTETEINERLDRLWDVMTACIERGCLASGMLPGSLHVPRRAPEIFRKLSGIPQSESESSALSSIARPKSVLIQQATRHRMRDPLEQLDWVSLFALAVNEENAAGGRVVTAPTNGAAGIIPAVLGYYVYFYPDSDQNGVYRFLKTAGAIGLLYKQNASLSAAEMGCQGEVGVACSMAAAGLAACMGGSVEQIENAAEIGMEHNLGLTCDPVGGLVQVPCIERNTMGATKAINAARLAVLYGNGKHFVSLDRVIETMRQTGVDMQVKYKETSLGGLAVNVVDC